MSIESKEFAKGFNRNVNVGNGVTFEGMYTAKEFKLIASVLGIDIAEVSELNCYALFTTEPSKLDGMKYSIYVISPDMFLTPVAVLSQIAECAIKAIGSVSIWSEG